MSANIQETMSVLSIDAVNEQYCTTFNDKMASLPIFICKICKKLLSCPIMLIPNVGNICGSCVNEAVTISIHNEALEAILNLLAIPCHYYDDGCIKKLLYAELPVHEAMCRYRNYFCPLKLHSGCLWKGKATNLVQHGILKHQGLVLSCDQNSVQLTLDMSKDNEVIHLVTIADNVFVIHIKCDIQTLKQHYVVYYVGVPEKAEEFVYFIKAGFEESIEFGTKHTLNDLDLMNGMDKYALIIDLSLTYPLVKDKIVPAQVIIETENYNSDILSVFECPLCKKYMHPPIPICLTGHSICHVCRPKLNRCPTCCSEIGAARNFTLESLSEKIKFPCTYRNVGCREVFKYVETEKHEAECHFKSYICPFNEYSGCAWNGQLNALINHLETDHIEKVAFSNYNKDTVLFWTDTNLYSLYCMVFDELVFRVFHKRDLIHQNSYWAVQLVGPSNLAEKYTNEIGLIDEQNEHRRLVSVDVVQAFNANMFSKCITMPTSMVSWFHRNGTITYYCKIKKIN